MAAKKILIVEDNDLIAEVMSYILVSNGYNVTTLACGNDVFDKIPDIKPDLIIMDAKLPDMDGRDVCKALKSSLETQNLPVIMCSACDDIEKVLTQTGAPNDILPKPFDIEVLINKVALQLAA